MRQNWFWKVFLLGAVTLSFAAWQGHALLLRADDVPVTPTMSAFVSPLPTPPVVPTPVPTPSPQDVAALQYVAQHWGIPLGNLKIGQTHRRDYLSLDRHFSAYTILERGTSREFRLMIDLSDGSITEDIGAVDRADAEARQKRYGKFDRPLYERLQTAGEQDMLPVAIWVGGVRGRSEEELQQVLASRYPEVRDALARHAPLLDLADPALVRRVKQEYEQLKQDDIATRVGPLVAYLASQAVPVQSHSLLPSVAVTLTKSVILSLAQRDDVAALYLVAGVAEPALDAAVPTDRVVPLWTALGINGVAEPNIPQTIAIIERGNVALDNTFLHRSGTRLLADNGDQDHTTAVASAAASFHGAYRGMAPGAIILSAGENGLEPDQHYALTWALDQGAVIANLSECQYNNTPDLDWLDRAFDYTARTRHATITTAAGNRRQEYICSPAKGWNVITVGGINDHGTADWADDTMFYVPGQTPDYGSSYRDPGSPHGDRQKPEVAAPAQDITALGLHNNPLTSSGTSLAAPQVAGLAALLMQRNAQLSGQPTAVKAILMASALHNVEGAYRLSDEDGAGSIHAALADTIAQTKVDDGVTCAGPCWWAVGTQSNYPSPGGSLNEYFRASRGERIRVALAWWSLADPPPAYPTVSNDVLASDFELYVWGPSGAGVGSSLSWDNNYEIVDFVAPETGTYRVEIYKSSTTTESTNELGIAWVKDATYLADLRNVNGWASEIYVRNEGAEPLNATVHYFGPGGGETPKVSDTCSLVSNQQCWIPVSWDNRIPAGTLGTAIVGGGEEIDVAVLHYKSNGLDADNGLQAGGSSDRAFAQAATVLYAPAVYNNIYAVSSVLQVRFNGAVDDQVSFWFRGRSGYPEASWSTPIPPNGRLDVSPSQVFGTNAWVGSVVVSSNQPLAVDVLDTFTDGHTRTANAAAGGATTLYAPALYRAAYGLTSGIVVQNVGYTPTFVELRFCNRPGTVCTPYQLNNGNPLLPGYAAGVHLSSVPGLTDGWTGSARILGSGGQPLAAVVQIDQPGVGDFAYNAASVPARTILLPRAAKNYDGRTTSYLIQNASATSALQVTATYYDEWGAPTGAPVVYPPLAPLASMGRYQGDDTQLIAPWRGSIVLTADGPWAVAVARENSSNSISAASGIPR